MLEPFREQGSRIIYSSYGRQRKNKGTFNHGYYRELASSEYGLCPHQKNFSGIEYTMWTYRFLECVMCKTVPVVFSETPLGSEFLNGFDYIVDKEVISTNSQRLMCESNYKVFLKRHTL